MKNFMKMIFVSFLFLGVNSVVFAVGEVGAGENASTAVANESCGTEQVDLQTVVKTDDVAGADKATAKETDDM